MRSLASRSLPVLAALAGALLAILLGGSTSASIGPFDASLSVHPAVTGDTLVRLAPLGTVRLDTHDGPLGVEVRIDELRLDEAEAIVADPDSIRGLEDELADGARAALVGVALRSALAAVLGGVIGAVVLTRRHHDAVVGAVTGVVAVIAVGATGGATWRADAIAEPTYTGVLTAAPRLAGGAEAVVDGFDRYRAQLADLVANATELYRTGSVLPTAPGAGAIRLLHVSDVHLNPAAYDLMAELVERFDVRAVVDTGDTTDWGTEPEGKTFEAVGRLGVPYVWVRGNHDSLATQAAMAALPNVAVVDGEPVEVAGLRFFGAGDPRYTPEEQGDPDEERRAGARALADQAVSIRTGLERLPAPPDVLLVHDARAATRAGGLVPLVLAGHTHEATERRLPGGAVLLVEGSTGGAGLRGLQGRDPEPLTCSVLHLDAVSHRLLAYDRITVAGLGRNGVRIERHVVAPEGPDDAGR